MMTASNLAFSEPAATSFSVIVVNGTRYLSNIQRVQPTSIDSEPTVRKIATRRARLSLNAVVNFGSAIALTISPVAGASPMTAATSTPNSSGSVWAVTSYGRFGGPPG